MHASNNGSRPASLPLKSIQSIGLLGSTLRACDDLVKGNPYMKGAFPALAFWSLKGETEQQFYRRVVLALEELLLGIVMAREFSARRRLRSGAHRSARSSLVVSTQRPRRSS